MMKIPVPKKKKNKKFTVYNFMWCWLVIHSVRITYSCAETIWAALYEGLPKGISAGLWFSCIVMLMCYSGGLWIMCSILNPKDNSKGKDYYLPPFFTLSCVQTVIAVIFFFGFSSSGGLQFLSGYDKILVTTWVISVVPMWYLTIKTSRGG